MTNSYSYNEARTMLSQLSVDELKQLMNNEDALVQFVRKLSEVQQLEATKKSLEERIRILAAQNLEQEPELNREKQKLIDLHNEISQKKEQYRRLNGQEDEDTSDRNPDVALALLQSAAADLDRETEERVEDFFYGTKSEDEMTDFERRFIEDRKRVHELKIKAEKFQELLQMSSATSYLNSNHQYRPNSYR